MTIFRSPAHRVSSSTQRGAMLLSVAMLLACKVTIGGGSTSPEDEGDKTKPERLAPTLPAETDPKIDGPRMLADLETLAGDDFAGRYTFSKHIGMAADHLAAQYTEFGIAAAGSDGYRAPFMAPAGREPTGKLIVWVMTGGDSKLVAGKEITTLTDGNGDPAFADAVSVASLSKVNEGKVKGRIVVAAAPERHLWEETLKSLSDMKASGVVLIGDGPAPDPATTKDALSSLTMPVAWLSTQAANDWMGIKVDAKRGPKVAKNVKISIAAEEREVEKPAFNVVAYMPGAAKADEIVVIGAHYDHIGTTDNGHFCSPTADDSICNGADDNGSGTVMVLEVARAFRDANLRPERTVVFAHFAGEELGLHGSKAIAADPPDVAPFTDGKVVAMVNLDMVGRYGEGGLAIGGIGSSDAWMPLLDELGNRDLSVVYERAINARSDHASYYRHKIPVLFFFTGLHDDYHKVGDHYDKINGEGMVSIAQLVADLVHRLADGHDIPYAAPRSKDEGVVSRMPGASDRTVEKRSETTTKE